MSVYGYIRINSRRPRPQKFSLLQQSRMIRSFAESQGWPFKQTLRDIVISDRSDHWPRLNHLKQLIISGKVSRACQFFHNVKIQSNKTSVM